MMADPSQPWHHPLAELQSERSRLEGELLTREEEAVWPGVRDHLLALEKLVRAEEQLLTQQLQEVEGRINRQYALRYIDLAGAPFSQADLTLDGRKESCRTWLSGDGQTLAIPATHGPWASIRLFDPAAATWRGAILFRAGEGWELKDFIVREDGYWLAGGRGEVFVVARDGSRLHAVYPEVQLLGKKEKIAQLLLAPPHHQWLEIRNQESREKKGVVLDLGKRNLRQLGELGEYCHPRRLTGSEPLLVWRVLRLGNRALLHGGAGQQAVREEIKASTWIVEMALASAGPGWAVLSRVRLANPDWIPRLTLSWVGKEGSPSRHELEFLPIKVQAVLGLATSRRTGCSFLYFQDRDGNRVLVALVVSEEGISEQWRIPAAGDLILLCDDRSERVMAIFLDDGHRPRTVELGRQPPATLLRRKQDHFPFDFGLELFSCPRPPQARQPKVLTVYNQLVDERDSGHLDWITRQLENEKVEELLAYIQVFQDIRQPYFIPAVATGLSKIAPSHPEVVILRCTALALELKFSAIRAILETIDWSADLGEQSEHLHHLWGLIHLQDGDLAGAVQIWQAGLAKATPEDGGCQLAELVASVEEAWEFTQGMELRDEPGDFAWLLQSLQEADRYLQEGRGDKVIELLYCGRFWRLPTPHAMARLARACLQQQPRGAAEQLQWLIILGEFIELQKNCLYLTPRRPLPLAYRLESRILEQLQTEAQQWVEKLAWE